MTTLKVGVFGVGNSWKMYREDARALSFDQRPDAVEAALDAARGALGRGVDVELYVQGLDGEVRRIDPQILVQ